MQNILLTDANGTPIIQGPGYEMLKLVPLFSGGFGALNPAIDVANLPSYSAIGATTGNFTFASALPLEFAKGVGLLGMADGDFLPKLTINLNTTSAVYSTAPATTVPSLECRLNCDFYWNPVGENIEPPSLGTTRQWFYQQGNPTVASGGTTTVSAARAGGWLDTMIMVLRDSTGARIDAFPSVIRFSVDGINEVVTNLDEIYDDMAVAWGIGSGSPYPTRPTGVIAFSRKTSLGQAVMGLFDTGEVALSTSPGTNLSLTGAPWGTVSNSPATLNFVFGQIIPAGAFVQGLPEV